MALASRTQTIHFILEPEKGDPGEPGAPGEKGDRGPLPMGPLRWSQMEVGYTFQSGATGEEYAHYVYYDGNFYQCVATHQKTASNYPGSTTGENLWTLIENYETVATNLLLAQYALVENLGVRALEMYDSEGGVLCKIKDGDIVCNKGSFKDVTVEGAVTASTLDLKAEKSAMIVMPGGTITLPALKEGYARRVLIIINRLLRNTNVPITVQGEEDGVYIDKPRYAQSTGYKTSQVYASDGSCDYEAVGFYHNGMTFWAIYKLADATAADA